MKILVLTQLVPDLVEELVIDAGGNRLDPMEVRWVINEYDDFAIEQAILLKERNGGEVIVVAPGYNEADDALYLAAAKGADKLLKLSGDFESEINNHALARMVIPLVKEIQPDLILTGVSAHSHHDGALGAILAGILDLPYAGYVAGVALEGNTAVVRKEYPGGFSAEIEVNLPAILGIQASDTPPRYVPVSKVRQIMRTSSIEEAETQEISLAGGLAIQEMQLPQVTQKAELISGDSDEIARKVAAILKEKGLI